MESMSEGDREHCKRNYIGGYSDLAALSDKPSALLQFLQISSLQILFTKIPEIIPLSQFRIFLPGRLPFCATGFFSALILFQGRPMGWGKAGGNLIKNHYPRGLRIYGEYE